jgi:hypothetical protein
MKRDIQKRLQSLDSRRKGTDRIGELSGESIQEVLAKSLKSEAYEERVPAQTNTKYALGAMQAVDSDYTRVSLEEAERVGSQLRTRLRNKSIDVDFRLQGSVACDLHIRGISDVDLLTIDDRFFRYDTSGSRSVAGEYANPVSYNTLDALVSLRIESEKALRDAFPAAKVETVGPKAIKLTGGSLRRPIDVVPANWFDTSDYQRTGAEVDRGVEILDTTDPSRILNMPFRHIARINLRDNESLGGLKKAIRLSKNIKQDAIEDGTKIFLSSFDIASALWHSNIAALTVGVANELAILAEATRFLDFLVRNNDFAKTLAVPDQSRKIFDTDEKLESLTLLSLEMDDLATKVAREQAKISWIEQGPAEQWAKVLKESYIPG